MHFITWCDDSSASTTRAAKHQSCRTRWKGVLFSSHLQKSSRRRNSKWIHNPIWWAGPLESSGISFEGSHVLSMFLLNSKNQCYQKILILDLFLKTHVSVCAFFQFNQMKILLLFFKTNQLHLLILLFQL